MQRVVSINLNGNAYQVEENGYNALFAYLDAFDAALTDSPDRTQRLSDLERLIAEKCQALLGPHKSVVTSAEIDRLLLDMEPAPGQPSSERPAAEPATSSSPASGSAQASSSAGPGYRRLFQVREGAMISGVCVGLSEYLHLDVTLLRILFVVFALVTSGWGILGYGVLMFVLPKVDTRADASSGTAAGTVPPYHWPWDDYGKQEWRNRREDWRAQREQWRQQRRDWRDQRRAARMAYGPHPHPFGTIVMIIFLLLGFMWLSLWTRGHFFFGWPFFWGFPHWIGIIIFFMILRLIFMPFRAARWYGYGPYGPYAHPHYEWLSMWNGLLWFAAIIFAVWVAFHYIPEVHDFIRGFDSTLSVSSFHV